VNRITQTIPKPKPQLLSLALKIHTDLLLLIGRYTLPPLSEAGTGSQQLYYLEKLPSADVGGITLLDKKTWPVVSIAFSA
jgi:hypothetical protein